MVNNYFHVLSDLIEDTQVELITNEKLLSIELADLIIDNCLCKTQFNAYKDSCKFCIELKDKYCRQCSSDSQCNGCLKYKAFISKCQCSKKKKFYVCNYCR